jgi:GTP-binding protein HflX
MNEVELQDDLTELKALLATLGYTVASTIIQKRQKLSPRCLLGMGKVEEIKAVANNLDAELIVFDHALTPPQIRNLEEMTGKQIADRTGVILDIFSQHARTTQAKAQVEVAKLEYLLPRLAGAWTHFQRQTGGGMKSRGMGETQIEVDRRRARERINKLQRQLKQISVDKATQKKARGDEFKVALVGYTNSGKTTLMTALTKSPTKPQDKLFATLDTSIKKIDPASRPTILLSDTVGFIRNLPHGLVESFKSTLTEVKDADLLVHVVDISHKNYKSHMDTTAHVLREIGADHVPSLIVFNKADLVDDTLLLRIAKKSYPGSLVISAENPEDLQAVRNEINRFFDERLVRRVVEVASNDAFIHSEIYNHCRILSVDYSQDDKVIYEIQTTPEYMAKLNSFFVETKEARASLC